MSFSEWKINKLIDLSEKIGSGATPRGGSNVYLETGIPFIRSQNVYNCEFHEGGLVYIDEESARKLDNVKLCKNDIILNITGDSVARCTILPEKYIGGRVNQHVAIIRTNSKMLNSQFLKYFLVSPSMQAHMLSLARMGATRAALTKGMIESFEIPTPDIKEQEEIAHILSTLDDKIEVNNEINKTLENMAQAIFKQWFVDFEFPNEDGEPYKSSGGEMFESELGMIPKGWEVGSIYSIADIIYGAPFSSKLFNEDGEGLPLIRIRDLKLGNPQFYTTEEHKKGTIIIPGDILIGMDAEFRPTIWSGKKAYLNQRVCQIKSNKDYIHDYYLYELIKPHMQFFEFSKVGTTVIHLGKSDIDSIKVIIPNTNYLESFSNIVAPLHDKLVSLSIENRKLRKIRDILLPKLMSGEIRVPMEEEGDAS